MVRKSNKSSIAGTCAHFLRSPKMLNVKETWKFLRKMMNYILVHHSLWVTKTRILHLVMKPIIPQHKKLCDLVLVGLLYVNLEGKFHFNILDKFIVLEPSCIQCLSVFGPLGLQVHQRWFRLSLQSSSMLQFARSKVY